MGCWDDRLHAVATHTVTRLITGLCWQHLDCEARVHVAAACAAGWQCMNPTAGNVARLEGLKRTVVRAEMRSSLSFDSPVH
jgi:hypothetical protein